MLNFDILREYLLISTLQSEHERIVTKLLSDKEIIGSDGELYDEDNNRVNLLFNSNPLFDLTHFLKTLPPEPSRWGSKYIFVK